MIKKTEKQPIKENINQKLEEKIKNLEAELQEQKEITKQAQYSYVNLKMDFERLMNQTQEKEKNMEIEVLLKIVKKFIPFVENLRKSLEVVPEDKKSDSMIKGLQLIYDNFIKSLEETNIYPIQAYWLEPDSLLHEPVSIQPIEDKNLKWKIIQEFQRGFVYKKSWLEKVIVPAKVVVGQ